MLLWFSLVKMLGHKIKFAMMFYPLIYWHAQNMKEKKKLKSIIDAPICMLENLLEYGIDSRKLRRLWLLCFLVSAVSIITLISMYFAETFCREYLIAFISLTAGLVAAFLIAWINEVSKEKESKKRRVKFRRYYIEKYKQTKTAKQKEAIIKQIEERNLFEDKHIFSDAELSDFDTLVQAIGQLQEDIASNQE